MRVITREFFKFARRDTMHIVPLGDIHIGAKACDETLFRSTVKRIKEAGHYWVGMGDYCDFVNMSDKRFDPGALADWITAKQFGDLAAAQRDRFLDIVKPIAGQCLALVCGNHESSIRHRYERDIYHEIVSGVKQAGGFKADDKLGLGYYGWLRLRFYRGAKKVSGCGTVTLNLHHGFVGGRLAGAKALNMERWLWTHDADLVLFGHSHNAGVQATTVEALDKNATPVEIIRRGAYCGTFLRTAIEGATTYSERKGYFPLPTTGVEVILTPGKVRQVDRVRVLA